MDKIEKKTLRRRFGSLGWAMLIYTGIMNLAVILVMLVQILPGMIRTAITTGYAQTDPEAIQAAAFSGVGYLLAIFIGAILLMLWKKPVFYRQIFCTRGRPMKVTDFLSLLCLTVGCQLIFQIMATVQELILNMFGLSAVAALQAATLQVDNFSMFLYAGIFGPIAEEILFRGLILRTLEPYGKRFAILLSAFLFAIFHGNVVQTPYAFCVGLVMGYAAIEHSMLWAIVLHIFNNLVLADMLSRLTAFLPAGSDVVIQWVVILLFSLGAAVVAIRRRKDIQTYIRENKVDNRYVSCFFRSPAMILLILVSMAGIMLSVSPL